MCINSLIKCGRTDNEAFRPSKSQSDLVKYMRTDIEIFEELFSLVAS